MILVLSALADPCGMVPPIVLDTSDIQRDGVQRTYVFHRDGMEVIALRPGFVGTTSDFGMLIPFPAAPSLHKIPDVFFEQLEALLDPSPLEIVLTPGQRGLPTIGKPREQRELAFDEVTELDRQAVGQYDVAVLSAGSAEALQNWMSARQFKFPTGMEAVTDEYIQKGWVFVAVRTRIGAGGSVPRPGMRTATPQPTGQGFHGHVQGMAFRFPIEEPLVPMRLSVFNGADPTNVVYAWMDEPVRIAQIPTSMVVLQEAGEVLQGRLTQPIPLEVKGGTLDHLSQPIRNAIEAERDPERWWGVVRQRVALDLAATGSKSLELDREKRSRDLLTLSSDLGLEGPALDAAIEEALADEPPTPVVGLDGMWLTVIEGVFPSDVLAAQDLRFSPWTLEGARTRVGALESKGRSVSFQIP